MITQIIRLIDENKGYRSIKTRGLSPLLPGDGNYDRKIKIKVTNQDKGLKPLAPR
jgi:hypothetical protein